MLSRSFILHKESMMREVEITVYRTLEWHTVIELPEEGNEKEDEEAITSLVASTVSADFNMINEEYVELNDEKRIDII